MNGDIGSFNDDPYLKYPLIENPLYCSYQNFRQKNNFQVKDCRKRLEV